MPAGLKTSVSSRNGWPCLRFVGAAFDTDQKYVLVDLQLTASSPRPFCQFLIEASACATAWETIEMPLAASE